MVTVLTGLLILNVLWTAFLVLTFQATRSRVSTCVKLLGDTTELLYATRSRVKEIEQSQNEVVGLLNTWITKMEERSRDDVKHVSSEKGQPH